MKPDEILTKAIFPHAYERGGDDRRSAINKVRAGINSMGRKGYALVPIEPTDTMVNAGGYAIQEHTDLTEITATLAYRAMLARKP